LTDVQVLKEQLSFIRELCAVKGVRVPPLHKGALWLNGFFRVWNCSGCTYREFLTCVDISNRAVSVTEYRIRTVPVLEDRPLKRYSAEDRPLKTHSVP
jgi:hypothetical protein